MSDLPHVTAVLKDLGFVDDSWFTDTARDRGTALHLATQFLDEGDLDPETVDPCIRGRLEGYRKFLAEVKPEILAVEEPVENKALRYCGTLDRRVVIGGKEGVLDLKAGTPAPWHALQLAAYAGCFTDRSLKRWSLYVTDQGTYKLIEQKDRKDYAVFGAALTVYHWKHGGNHA